MPLARAVPGNGARRDWGRHGGVARLPHAGPGNGSRRVPVPGATGRRCPFLNAVPARAGPACRSRVPVPGTGHGGSRRERARDLEWAYPSSACSRQACPVRPRRGCGGAALCALPLSALFTLPRSLLGQPRPSACAICPRGMSQAIGCAALCARARPAQACGNRPWEQAMREQAMRAMRGNRPRHTGNWRAATARLLEQVGNGSYGSASPLPNGSKECGLSHGKALMRPTSSVFASVMATTRDDAHSSGFVCRFRSR